MKQQKKLYDKIISFTSPRTYFRIIVESGEHHNAGTKLLSFSELSYKSFKKQFFENYDDNNDLFNGKWAIQLREIPSGAGMLEDVPKFLQKRGISIVYNDDNYCGQRCLALADAKNHDDLKNMKKKNECFVNMWSKRAVLISEEIDVKGRMSFTDFDKWSDLRHKQVVILSEMFKEIYQTEVVYPEKVYIYYDSKIQHYHYIHDINSATNDICRNSKWCKSCHKSFRFDNRAFATHK